MARGSDAEESEEVWIVRRGRVGRGRGAGDGSEMGTSATGTESASALGGSDGTSCSSAGSSVIAAIVLVVLYDRDR